MRNAFRFALLTLALAPLLASAQDRGGAQAAKDAVAPPPDFSFCVSLFTAEGLKKEAFYTNVASTGDTATMKQYLEDFAWSGDNAMLKGMADVATECATFHSADEAASARDHKTAAAVVAGFTLQPEFKY